ncbi:hypothetical protein [Paraburkholderia atlantica]|uniref:hypothetical protein n=1 Tax=Paraburkholderia atlantica TaxID=2654982 RepID=UPI003D240A21
MDQFKHVAALVKAGIGAQSAAAIVRATDHADKLRRENPQTALERFDAIGHTLAIAADGTVTDKQAVVIVEILREILAG